MPLSTPRLTPLADAECTPEQLALLEELGDGSSLHIFRTLVRHPKLYRRWLPFAGRLLQGSSLPTRDRELIILRVAWRSHAAYEWGQHVGIGRSAGLTDAEIVRVATDAHDATPSDWSSDDVTLLRAVDQLLDDHAIDDATWATLTPRYGDEQLVELTMLTGAYAMLAGTLNSLGVQLEGEQPTLGQV